MSQETVERVYTINLGKVLLSPNNQRAKRAINMIREFAIHHMKSEDIKIEEDVSHLVWARGIRRPPRKIRVKLTKDDDGTVLISKYQEEKPKKEAVEKKPKSQKTEKVEEKSEAKPEEPKPAKSELMPEKKLETKEEPKAEAKPEKPKKEQKSEKKTEEKTKTKSDAKRKKK
ncbi:MAG TPA: 50S ribosomal protein L31e [Nitrosopumilaceae archaeon]|nr:50S ribosomal protein L31e [Nitrosopumilaceae archaeon]